MSSDLDELLNAGFLTAERFESLNVSLSSDPQVLQKVMRNFGLISRKFPSIFGMILSIDGVSSDNHDYWLCWKDAVLDIGSDATDQSHLLMLITRLCSSLTRPSPAGSRASECLVALTRLVPNMVSVLLNTLDSTFPFWKVKNSLAEISAFSENLLFIAQQIPLIQESVLEMIISRALQIDVSIQVEIEDLDDSMIEIVSSKVFEDEQLETCEEASDDEDELHTHMEPNMKIAANPELMMIGDSDDSDDEEMSVEEEEDKGENIVDQVKDLVGKLDSILYILFEYIKKRKDNSGEIRELSLALLRIFEKLMLPSLKCRYTHFLIFYAASCDYIVSDQFLGLLVKKLFDNHEVPGESSRSTTPLSSSFSSNSSSSNSSVILIVAAAFIGGFVSRAQFLSTELIKLTFDMLLMWCNRQIDLQEASSTALNRSTFAAVVQAIMYIFCFRHEVLVENQEKFDAIYRNQFVRILDSSFSPVHRCLQSVTEEFVDLANEIYGLDYQSEIELNRFRHRNAYEPLVDHSGFVGDFDSYFPFDPFKLPLSRKFVTENLYREWQG